MYRVVGFEKLVEIFDAAEQSGGVDKRSVVLRDIVGARIRVGKCEIRGERKGDRIDRVDGRKKVVFGRVFDLDDRCLVPISRFIKGFIKDFV